MTISKEPLFQTSVHGKWILTGEHAVLRGCPAILFPLPSKTLKLKYWQSEKSDVRATFSGEYTDQLRQAFSSVLQRAIENLNLDHNNLFGQFHLENNIPIGAGLGASAALCVVIGRWFIFKKHLSQKDLFEFAKHLENLFHNESSGADIAAVMSENGIRFSQNEEIYSIKPSWKPNWTLSYSGKPSATALSVKKVKELWLSNPKLAQAIDDDMERSVKIAEKALSIPADEGFSYLKEAIEIGRNCFERWGLIEEHLERHINQLLDKGAVAAKPIGSGQGGFVVSLWRGKPKRNLGLEMI